jgi:peptidoglycan hydrolase CwlO-like protein
MNTADEHKLPQNNTIKVYSKPDDNIYKLNDMGVETMIQAGSVVAGGDVYGAPSSIDNAIVLFDGNSGKVIKQNTDLKYQDGFLIAPDIETMYTFSLNDELKKIQNFQTSSTDLTTINGLLRVYNVAVDRISNMVENVFIDFTTENIELNAKEVLVNGENVITSNLQSDINLGDYDINLPLGVQTLKGINATQILQNEAINDTANRVQNITGVMPDNTIFTGHVETTSLKTSTIQSGEFVRNAGLSGEFLKADGSIDINSYALNSSLATTNNNITATNTNVTNLTTSLSTTNSNVTGLTTNLATTNTNVSDLTTSLNTTNTNVSGLTTGLATTNTNLATTNTNVSGLTTSINTTNTNVSGLTTGLATTNTNLATTNTNVSGLTTSINTTNSNVSSLTTNLATTNTNVTTLQNKTQNMYPIDADFTGITGYLKVPVVNCDSMFFTDCR